MYIHIHINIHINIHIHIQIHSVVDPKLFFLGSDLVKP
jgi:hypothetical protein